MSELSIVIIVLAVMLSGILLRLLMPGKKSSPTAASTFRPNLADKPPTAKPFAYFPQIRQALSAADSQYLRNNAPPDVAKQALRERRAVARRFLQGLHE